MKHTKRERSPGAESEIDLHEPTDHTAKRAKTKSRTPSPSALPQDAQSIPASPIATTTFGVEAQPAVEALVDNEYLSPKPRDDEAEKEKGRRARLNAEVEKKLHDRLRELSQNGRYLVYIDHMGHTRIVDMMPDPPPPYIPRPPGLPPRHPGPRGGL
ncbi:hypothetical protein EXIGLDRAFT_776607 [Exidia glandulosa HHB12029]|uniref:Uncharacterized protein n=1 Tax=Exidia glandulosa HHB12029 TaxID=1314781 RepID=A0A165DEE6_EXIGL|nr:hypothetical protein EXIGLDRAFT_776607 [Exidia glandulosa HHB12029]